MARRVIIFVAIDKMGLTLHLSHFHENLLLYVINMKLKHLQMFI